MILEHNSYRNFLKCELADRIARNSSYSLRSFAQNLGISPATLSMVLSGKKNLSLESANQIAAKLNLEPKEADYFSLLVQVEAAKSMDIKEKIIERLNALNPKRARADLTLEYFRIISDWYHFAILMLTEIKDFEFNPASVSKRIGISRFEAETAIERLTKLDLLEKDPKNAKKYKRVKGDIVFKSDHTSEALQKYNRQILEKAIESVKTQTAKERLIGSEVIAINQAQLKEANNLMEDFFSKILTLAQNADKKTDVYCVGVQIFNLSKPRSEK
jgi:uncharacterized protein (TIGR02147 family)